MIVGKLDFEETRQTRAVARETRLSLNSIVAPSVSDGAEIAAIYSSAETEQKF